MPIIRLPVPGEVPVAMLSTTEFPEPAGDSAVIGTSTYAARADHVHSKQEIDISDKLSISNPQPPGTASPGMSLFAAREDHVHPEQIIPNVPTIPEELLLASNKVSPTGSDILPILDSTASNALKQLTINNLSSYLNIRPRLSATLNLYVRKDGNDSNDGKTNTAGGAVLTIQRAIDYAYYRDTNGFDVIINIADGIYYESLYFRQGFIGMGELFLIGNQTTPANVQIISTSGTTTAFINSYGRASFRGIKFSNTGSGNIFTVEPLGKIDVGNIELGTGSGSFALHFLIRGYLIVSSNYKISGGAYRHWSVDTNGILICIGKTITITNTPNFGGQFAFADMNGTISCQSNTYSGSATGQKYYVQGGASIQTYSGNVNIFPGNIAGQVGTGGYYG